MQTKQIPEASGSGNSWKKWITLSVIVLTILIIVKVGYDLKWFDVASGIFRLETDKKSKVKRFSVKTLSFVTWIDGEQYFIDELARLGWTYFRHYGRGMIFVKEGYEILIYKKTFFGRYNFYEVATREVFDLI